MGRSRATLGGTHQVRLEDAWQSIQGLSKLLSCQCRAGPIPCWQWLCASRSLALPAQWNASNDNGRVSEVPLAIEVRGGQPLLMAKVDYPSAPPSVSAASNALHPVETMSIASTSLQRHVIFRLNSDAPGVLSQSPDAVSGRPTSSALAVRSVRIGPIRQIRTH